MQFGFTPGRGTIDSIFSIRQLQENFLDKNKNLYLKPLFIQAFDRVPCKVLWWEMLVLGVPEWIIAVVQAM